MAYFPQGNGEPFLVVGTAVGTQLVPRSCKEGWLRVYTIKDNGRTLELLHKVNWTS